MSLDAKFRIESGCRMELFEGPYLFYMYCFCGTQVPTAIFTLCDTISVQMFY